MHKSRAFRGWVIGVTAKDRGLRGWAISTTPVTGFVMNPLMMGPGF